MTLVAWSKMGFSQSIWKYRTELNTRREDIDGHLYNGQSSPDEDKSDDFYHSIGIIG